jgi:hypothetical protein
MAVMVAITVPLCVNGDITVMRRMPAHPTDITVPAGLMAASSLVLVPGSGADTDIVAMVIAQVIAGAMAEATAGVTDEATLAVVDLLAADSAGTRELAAVDSTVAVVVGSTVAVVMVAAVTDNAFCSARRRNGCQRMLTAVSSWRCS